MMNDSMIVVSNSLTCLVCGDTIYSATRHDYKTCSCGSCMVDGGTDYLRMGYKDIDEVKIQHIEASESFLEALISEVQKSMESGRNARGVAYAALRAIRDSKGDFTTTDLGTTWYCNED